MSCLWSSGSLADVTLLAGLLEVSKMWAGLSAPAQVDFGGKVGCIQETQMQVRQTSLMNS